MKYLLLLGLLASCGVRDLPFSSNILGPKFKVGDCTAHSRDLEHKNEFLENQHEIRKIEKIGNENYLYSFGYQFQVKSEWGIASFDRTSEIVSCPKGEK